MIYKVLNGIKIVNKAQGYIGGGLVMATALVMLYDVVMRYIAGSPSIRAPFLASFLMLSAIFVGTAYALQHGGHVHLSILLDKLKPLPVKICLTVGYCFAGIFVYFLARESFNHAVTAARMNRVAVGHLPVPLSILYGIMVFGLAMLLISLAGKLVEVWLNKEDN